MKLFKTRRNLKIKIWCMLGEMIKRWGKARFYLPCNYSCKLYFLMKVLLVKLKNFYSSELNLNYGTAKH